MTEKKREGNEIADEKGSDSERTRCFGEKEGQLQEVLSLVVLCIDLWEKRTTISKNVPRREIFVARKGSSHCQR